MPSIERGPLKRVVQAGTAGAIAVAGIFGGASDGGRILTQALNTLRNPGHSADDPQFSTRNASVSRVDAQSNTPEKYQIFFPGIMRNFRPGGVHIQPIETSTPEPTSTPDTRPSYPWPLGMETERKYLPTLERVNLARYTDRSEIPYPDIKDALLKDGWGISDWQRKMVHVLMSDDVYKQRGLFVVGHEYFHLHQVRIVQDNNLQPPWQQSYLNTPEGEEFVVALDKVINNSHSQNIGIAGDFADWAKWLEGEFVVGGNYYENAADIASIWYNYPNWLDNNAWNPIKEFAATRWPKA